MPVIGNHIIAIICLKPQESLFFHMNSELLSDFNMKVDLAVVPNCSSSVC